MTLPIMAYREEIINVVRRNVVTIIKAETGAGKSTQVPQFLLQCADKVVVTQPRRLAAMNLAERVAEEMGVPLGGLVGYKTALEKKKSDLTNLIFCTDGLEIVSHLLGARTPQGVLIVDEVHEWNMSIEMLIAWSRIKLKHNASYKLVLMSANVDPEPLVTFFGDVAVVTVPGRTFPIEEREPKSALEDEATDLLRAGRSVLVFLPGKKQIADTVTRLQSADIEARILALHAEMPLEEQQRCFDTSEVPKCVVATNVAQTSLTIPGIDVVLDSGLEWRKESIDGVEGMYLRPISLNDREQRKGRAGRTKPGVYLDFCETPREKRPLALEPEITRLPMEKTLLLFAHMGVDIEVESFFHSPTPSHMDRAREVLRRLGCMDESGGITPIGRRVVAIPASVRWARVLVEAEKRGVLEQAVLLASVHNGGRGLISSKFRSQFKLDPRVEPLSDGFLEFQAFEMADALPTEELDRFGIDPGAYKRAAIFKKQLYEFFWRDALKAASSTGNIKDLVSAFYTGFPDCLYKRSVLGGYYDSRGKRRDLPKESIVADAPLLIGIPHDVQKTSTYGPEKSRLLVMATRVDLELFIKVAPHLVKVEEGKTIINGMVVS